MKKTAVTRYRCYTLNMNPLSTAEQLHGAMLYNNVKTKAN